VGRCLRIRRMVPPRPIGDRAAVAQIVGSPASRAVLAEIEAARVARAKTMS
jgi:beta-N-acetylhexosaminidase